jgi:hypothetical protein
VIRGVNWLKTRVNREAVLRDSDRSKFGAVSNSKGIIEPVQHVDETDEESQLDPLRIRKRTAESLVDLVGNTIRVLVD